MIDTLQVKITNARLGETYFYIDFEADILYDDGKKEIWREYISISKEERNEEIIKQKIMEKIERHCLDIQGREFGEKLKDKIYKNEDFAFSKIFEVKH